MAAVDADAQAQRQRGRGRRPMKVLMVANPDEGALVGYATPRRSTARASPPKRSDTPTSFVSVSGSGARSSNSPAPDNYPEAERIIVAVTHDAENYFSVDLTGHTEAQAIRKCILSKLPISNDPCSTVFIYRIEIDGVAIGSALDDTELMIDCQCYGDDKGSLKFLVLCSDNPDPPEPASTIAPIQPTLPSSSSLSPPSYSRPRSAPPDNVRPGNEYSVAPVPTVSEPRFADAETTWSQNQSLHRRPLLHNNQHPGLSWGIQGTPSPPTRLQNIFVRRLPRPPPRQQYPIQQEPRALLPSTTHPLPPDSEYEDISTSKRQTSASSSHRQSTAPMARIDHIRGDSTAPSRPTAWSTLDLPDRPYHSFDGSRSALQRPVADPGAGNNRHSLPSRPLPRTPQHSTPPPIDTHSHDPYSHQSPDDQVHDIYDGMEDPTRTLRLYKARPRSASPSYVAGNATLGTPKPEHASLDGSRTALPSLSDASTVGSHMLDANDHDLIIAISDVSDSPGIGDDVDPPVPAPGPRLVSQSMTPPPVARYVSPTPETISRDLVAQETQLYGDDSEGGGTSWQMPGQDSAPPTSSVDIGTPFISQTATPPSELQLRIDRTSLRSGANSPALTQTTLAPVLPLAVRKKTALGAEKRSDGELTPTLLANHQSSRTFSKCETHPQAGEAPEKLDRNTSNFKSGRSIVETPSVSDCTSSVAKSPLTGSANGIVTNVKMGNPASDAQSTVKIQSGQISCEEMFRYLVDHGCKDLSSHMDPGGYSSGLVQGGAFGDIWKGKLHDETELAIKVWRFSSVSQEDAKPMKRAMREIYHWSKAKHENIQELMGVIMFQGRLGMVSLWMKHGNLRDFVRKNPNTDRLSWCVQVAAGLSYLHDQNMVHGDLKAANILVSEDCAAKICDFDHSILSECTLVFSDTTNAGGGTLRWMAPELLLSSEEGGGPPARRSKQSDVYALGMTLLRMASEKAQEIVTGQVPYSDYRYDQGILRALDRRQHPARPAALQGPEGWGPKMWMMLLECWDHDPTVRPPASQVHERLESIKNQA